MLCKRERFEEIESGEEIIALTRIIEDLEEVSSTSGNSHKNLNATLESDVTFDVGKYDLGDWKEIVYPDCAGFLCVFKASK